MNRHAIRGVVRASASGRALAVLVQLLDQIGVDKRPQVGAAVHEAERLAAGGQNHDRGGTAVLETDTGDVTDIR